MNHHRSNLESFLHRTTPMLRSQSLPKSSLQDLNADCHNHPMNNNKDTINYFNLGHLWDCYDEWSAYGLGTPVTFHGRTVVQYFTPYLSAIQIYTSSSSKPSPAATTATTTTTTASSSEMGGDSESESWSSDSSEAGGVGAAGKLSRSSSSNSDRPWDADDLVDVFCWPVKNRFGDLYMEHFEEDGPFGRVPLKDKIEELALKYPGLRSFNSIDLSAASWMAVAWYPIYNIPPGRNSRDINASFLTYHTLSSSFQDDDHFTDTLFGSDQEAPKKKQSGTVSLSPFGLATYRMQPWVWLDPETSDQELLTSLSCAADSWLKQLQVHHHDFTYFVAHPL